jgi:hypothetical protein
MGYTFSYTETNRFGSNWIHRQDVAKETERPFNTPTVRYSRKLTSRTYSSTESKGISSCRGSLRFDPTDEGFLTYPEYFFGLRAGRSNSSTQYGNLPDHSLYTCGVRTGSPYSWLSVIILGQRISKGTLFRLFAKSESINKLSRRVIGKSNKHCCSIAWAWSSNILYFKNRRNFSLCRLVWTIQNVSPGLCREIVFDLHRKVSRKPTKLPTLSFLRDEFINV